VVASAGFATCRNVRPKRAAQARERVRGASSTGSWAERNSARCSTWACRECAAGPSPRGHRRTSGPPTRAPPRRAPARAPAASGRDAVGIATCWRWAARPSR